jgi:glycosyltransferase involved in cell wall biosynthesis
VLTVTLATRDRADRLAPMLGAFARLVAPAGGWTLVIVDNGSKDHTADLLRRYRSILPLVVIEEPVAGKSRALNRAIGLCNGEPGKGELVVVTDDDVLPEPDWLIRYAEAAARHPEAAIFGGAVLPEWPQAPPAWLGAARINLAMLFALVNRPSGPCDFGAIFGPNMAVRATLFRDGARFAEAIGPNSTTSAYPMGSESEFIRRMLAGGQRAWFVAEARVRHIIRREQLDPGWVLGRAFRNGLGVGLTAPPSYAAGQPTLDGVPLGLLARRLFWRAAAWTAAALPDPADRLAIRFQDRWFAGLDHAMRENDAG